MADTKKSFEKWNMHSATPILLLLVSIPVSMLMWAGNLAFSRLKLGTGEVIPPTRWLAATLIPLAFAAWGLKRRSINKSGALIGLLIAFILTLASYAFLVDLIVFFVTSSKATKYKQSVKNKIDVSFKEGSQRNWIQGLCNCGMAAQLAVLYLLDSGSGERPIDFSVDFRSSWLSVGILGAFACGNADTWASELGTVLSKNDPFLITTGKRVPKGVNGGVSWVGLVLSFLGGAVVGVGHFLVLYFCSIPPISQPQWKIIPIAAFAGLIGSIIDSLLGATLQYSGVNKKNGMVVETPGPGVEYICGIRVLDNHSVNLLSTILTGLLTPRIAVLFWPR
ncbi:transmembrane protein 19 [Halyomorpha halys]|uniref:transmembrane protein 19 n=1 Tax=Halyomorpha halys TaxID=286706 RepID=UPI0006D4EC3C|nr:transmembrane protein 19 [Halyomorpha halys]